MFVSNYHVHCKMWRNPGSAEKSKIRRTENCRMHQKSCRISNIQYFFFPPFSSFYEDEGDGVHILKHIDEYNTVQHGKASEKGRSHINYYLLRPEVVPIQINWVSHCGRRATPALSALLGTSWQSSTLKLLRCT